MQTATTELVSIAQDGSALSVIPQTAATTKPTTATQKKLTLIPLIFVIYFEVAGGPYGEEPAVQAAGPFFALIGFLIFPFMWCVPQALITAELTTAMPGNGGFVLWADRAFGPFWGSLMGTWKFLSNVINIASFPVYCIEYLTKLFPVFASGWPRYVAILGSTLALSFLNYTGLTIFGYAAVVLAVVSLAPFILITFAGEVDNPKKTFPMALLVAVIITCVSYLAPLFAVIGSVSVDQSFVTAVGLFEAQLSSSVFRYWFGNDVGICCISLVEMEVTLYEEALSDSDEVSIAGDYVLDTIRIFGIYNGYNYQNCVFG
ncbi:hypothetical protein RIF29_16919 [Crotalaria pallida]|uniref:Uncharacterized protein n=1 Tax=Crotalaria pallida TaxID=3830 RepID=A0AAN9FHD1_CROPI